MNQLFKITSLETTFGINMLALDHLKPVVMNIKEMVERYIAHREEVVKRRTKFDLEKAEQRAHILEGFLKALENIDEVIAIIKASKTPKIAADRLIERFAFTRAQADAILDMRLARLTGLEQEKIQKEYEELQKLIAELREILKSRSNILRIIVKELKDVVKKHDNPRRTDIIDEEGEIDIKDLVIEEDVVVTISHDGFIKRTPITAFRKQGRGGVGVNTSALRESDFIEQMFVASTHDTMLFLSSRGKAYTVEVHEIINASRNAKGQSIKLLLSLEQDEWVAATAALHGGEEEKYVLFITRKGYTKKVSLDEFRKVRKSGIIAMNLDEDDQMIDAAITDGKRELLITTALGKALRIKEKSVRPMGRTARGVIGVRLGEGDFVCSIRKVIDGADLMVVTEKGYGKRVAFKNFSPHGRGTGGQIYLKVTRKTGRVIGVLTVSRRDDFVVITERGMIIKLRVRSVSMLGRNAGGVIVVNLKESDAVVGVAGIVKE
jgi:DNA gyrase subunit A